MKMQKGKFVQGLVISMVLVVTVVFGQEIVAFFDVSTMNGQGVFVSAFVYFMWLVYAGQFVARWLIGCALVFWNACF